MKMLKIDCRKCANCDMKSCAIYGDNADEAVSRCAEDGFKNYDPKKKQEG
jgi:hypothetical protein